MTSQPFQDAVDVFSEAIARGGVRNVIGCQIPCTTREPNSRRVRLLQSQSELQFVAYSGQFLLLFDWSS